MRRPGWILVTVMTGICFFFSFPKNGYSQNPLSDHTSDKQQNSVFRLTGTGSPDAQLPFGSHFADRYGRKIHELSVEERTGYIIPTNALYEGNRNQMDPFRYSWSLHLKYSFRFQPDSRPDKIFGGVYQGVGLAWYSFNNQRELGNPVVLYLFQGARIGRLSRGISLNYEWNFGLSYGWKPYNYYTNSYNTVIGSKLNAYINASFYFRWLLTPTIDMTTGVAFTHFSNGNTQFPNAGLNTAGLKLGLIYKLNRQAPRFRQQREEQPTEIFPRHVSYDLVFFGAWRRTGVDFQDQQIASPKAYTVMGFNFNPMVNMGYKLRLGASLDGVYDGGANVYTEQNTKAPSQHFYQPPLDDELSLGISARAEYVMPYFSVNMGLGNNFYGKGDLKASYQILALKIGITRKSFVHIGYSLKDFHTPNFLMLGIGFRFHNKYPSCYR